MSGPGLATVPYRALGTAEQFQGPRMRCRRAARSPSEQNGTASITFRRCTWNSAVHAVQSPPDQPPVDPR